MAASYSAFGSTVSENNVYSTNALRGEKGSTYMNRASCCCSPRKSMNSTVVGVENVGVRFNFPAHEVLQQVAVLLGLLQLRQVGRAAVEGVAGCEFAAGRGGPYASRRVFSRLLTVPRTTVNCGLSASACCTKR